jgi:hypothetical protein
VAVEALHGEDRRYQRGQVVSGELFGDAGGDLIEGDLFDVGGQFGRVEVGLRGRLVGRVITTGWCRDGMDRREGRSA